MKGINLNEPITFIHASLRFFSKNEYHVTRHCKEDVLVMVFDGVLRFTEDGVSYEIHPGEYHIQKKDSIQKGEIVSDSPKYLYAHFLSEWTDDGAALPFKGTFNYLRTKELIEQLDKLSHTESTLTEKTSVFYDLLLFLRKTDSPATTCRKITDFIEGENLNEITLEKISKEFHFSKNHIINIFKKEMTITPVKYINNLKLKRAKHLLEATSDTLESIALKSGFNDYSHFYKLFYRENQVSPSSWRDKKQSTPSPL